MTNILKLANKLILSALLCSAAATQLIYAEDQPSRLDNPPPQSPSQAKGTERPPWQTFDLYFPGGSPRDLVSAIEKATGKSLNVIISREDESVEIPALKFKSITIPDLFRALAMASQRGQQVNMGVYNTTYTSFYSFETQGQGENAIFYFKCRQPSPPQEFCRFYQLDDYLQNYAIEDITTAIQTGWKMLDVKSPPQLKFHPETKLLIAVGPSENLGIIDSVLNGLRGAPPSSPRPPKQSQGLPPLQKKDAAPDKK
jgi:hypothetical protein